MNLVSLLQVSRYPWWGVLSTPSSQLGLAQIQTAGERAMRDRACHLIISYLYSIPPCRPLGNSNSDTSSRIHAPVKFVRRTQLLLSHSIGIASHLTNSIEILGAFAPGSHAISPAACNHQWSWCLNNPSNSVILRREIAASPGAGTE